MWTMLLPFISGILDKIIPDPAAREKAKLEMLKLDFEKETKSLDLQAGIIQQEATNTSWLSNSWRPLTMLIFLGFIISYWFGYMPPNATPDLIMTLFNIIQIGLGGYLIGRSGEKMVSTYVDGKKELQNNEFRYRKKDDY